MSKMFRDIGIKLPLFDMDIGNTERPEIKGYREQSDGQKKCKEKHHSRSWNDKDLRDIDFIYIMNFGDVDEVAEYYSQFGKPIIVHLFGQYNIHMVNAIINLMLKMEIVTLVCYSKTEYKTYYRLSYDNSSIRNRLFYIPFGLDLGEFNSWNGKIKSVYTTCNDIHNRGTSCGYDRYLEIVDGIAATLSGRNTEEIGGMGLLPFDELKDYYKKHRCYLSMGTIPAPYTLTPLEAMMTGCPTVIYDNGMGIADEDIQPGLVSSNVDKIRDYIGNCLNNEKFARSQSKHMRAGAIELFCIDDISKQWESIISQSI